ncbi:MAG: sn-glycerol-1-phosphate dehydrogenase [Thermomicrobiales bacterium]
MALSTSASTPSGAPTRIDRALVDRLLGDADTTRRVVAERGMLMRIGPIVADAFPGRLPIIVADDTTWAIAGAAVSASLHEAGLSQGEPIRFPGHPTLRATYDHVGEIADRLRAAASAAPGQTLLPLAVGSGTINDLVKRAAHELGLPYAVVGTAASMDGYTASGAALVVDGVKQTVPCRAPELVVADIDIVAAAPARMTAAGYGDLIGKVTAGADWLLADAVSVEPIVPEVWNVVQGPLPALIGEPDKVAAGNAAAIEHLFLGLVITGLAIQVAGNTRPASGSEHQFSHLWEMRGLEFEGEVVSHGFKVGLGTIVSSALYAELMDALDLDGIDIERAIARYPDAAGMERTILATHNHPALIAKAREECLAKLLTPDQLRERLGRLQAAWPTLSSRLRQQLPGPDAIRDLLARAGAPTTPEEIGLTRAQLKASYAAAQQIRRRYTVYDLALELGLLDELVERLFAPGGYWAP